MLVFFLTASICLSKRWFSAVWISSDVDLMKVVMTDWLFSEVEVNKWVADCGLWLDSVPLSCIVC